MAKEVGEGRRRGEREMGKGGGERLQREKKKGRDRVVGGGGSWEGYCIWGCLGEGMHWRQGGRWRGLKWERKVEKDCNVVGRGGGMQ